MGDSDVRRILLAELERTFKRNTETLIVEELGICQGAARVDIAVVNGSISGFEIKSDQDSLKRLPGQIEIYQRVLGFITLVVGNRHLDRAIDMIPKWWGIIVCSEKSGKLRLKKKRNAKPNPCIEPYAVAQLLWRDEAFAVLQELGIHRGYKNKPRSLLWGRLTELLSDEELKEKVATTLRSREYWRSACQQA